MNYAKIIGLVLGLSFLASAGIASASVVQVSGGSIDCSAGTFTDTNNVTSATTDLGACGGNGSPMLVQEAWGLTVGDSQKLIVPAGSDVTDEGGITYKQACPFFMGVFGCFNLTSLDYYKNQARTIAKQGVTRYNYWLTH